MRNNGLQKASGRRAAAAQAPVISRRDLLAENEQLRSALEEAQETLRAIRSGEVDAVVVAGRRGERVYTLHGADRSYRALIEQMNEGALTLRADGMILYANRTFAEMIHAPLESVMGSSLQDLATPDYRAGVQKLLRSRKKCHAEVTLVARDGASLPVYLSLTPMALDELRGCVGAVVLDLTEQKRAEDALRVSEAKFRNVFENASLGKALVGMDGRVEYNNALLAMLGYTAQELHGRDWKEISHPDDWQVLQNALKGVREERLAGARFEMRSVNKSGQTVWADVTLGLVKDPQGTPLYSLVSVYDITARKEADAALLELKQHLQRYVEAERLHLAQELHDVPLQELYGILYRLEEVCPRVRPENAAVISEVIGDVKSTLNSLRSIATELRPPTVSKFGFEKAARAFIQEFREKHPAMVVHASLKRDAQSLPEDTRLLLYRVLREAFSNILRHARATEINVRFEFDARQACLEIADNGKGFSVPENWADTVRGGHYGLAGMSERLSLVGGTLQISSTPGVSTTVRAVLPNTPQPARAAGSSRRSRLPRR